MAKEIKTGEETFRDTGFWGTLVSVVACSSKAGDVVDEMLGGEEKKSFYVEEDGKKVFFDNAKDRDDEALRRLRD
jgi:hypothetical protein